MDRGTQEVLALLGGMILGTLTCIFLSPLMFGWWWW